MTYDEIEAAVVVMKRRVQNVVPMQMMAERHVALFELIVDSEAILRGFKPRRPRADIEADIERELQRASPM